MLDINKITTHATENVVKASRSPIKYTSQASHTPKKYVTAEMENLLG